MSTADGKLEVIMSNSRFTKLAVVGALIAGLTIPVLAHNEGGSWWRGWGSGHMMGGGHGHGHGPMMGQQWREGMLERIDGRLAFLKTELKIKDDQKAAWDDFSTTVRESAETHNAMMRAMMTDMQDGKFFKKPLPERLTIRLTHMESRVEQIKGLQASVGKLYAALDDSQKKVADEIALPMMGMGMGRGQGMMH
jgi:hypothetical protein